MSNPGTPQYGSPKYGSPGSKTPEKEKSMTPEESRRPNYIMMSETETILLRSLLDLAKSSKEIEMEMRMQNLSLSMRDFNNVRNQLERLGFQQKGPSNKMLDIYVHKGDKINRDNLSNLRFTLSNAQIPNYCQAGTFSLSDAVLIYKGQVKWFESAFYDNSGLNKDQAEYNYGITSKQLRFANVDLREYNIRFGTKLEIPFDAGRRQFYLRTSRPSFELREALDQANNTFSQFLSIYGNNPNFRGIYKTFRLKQRVTYTHPLFGDRFRFDLTVVKSSVDDKPVTDFIDANLMERPKSYEIECELDSQNVSWRELEEFIETYLSDTLTTVQNHHLITRASDAKSILDNYKRDIRFHMNEEALFLEDSIRSVIFILGIKGVDENQRARRLADIERKSDTSIVKQLLYSGKSSEELGVLLKDVENRRMAIEKGIREWGRDNTYFIVPKVKSLDLTNLDPLNAYSITRPDYSVTDKTDGVTAILYINNEEDISGITQNKLGLLHGEAVLIDGNMRVMSLGFKVPKRAGAIIAGEYVADKGLFMAFDMYVNSDRTQSFTKLITKRPLKLRLELLELTMIDINKAIDMSRNPIRLIMKEFLFSDESTSIYACANKIWSRYKNGEFPYHLDGLIFTPNTAVGYSPNDIFYLLNPSRTWDSNLKWKPAEENTIDFYIVFERDVVVEYRGRQSTTLRKVTRPHNRDPTLNREYIVAKAYCGTRDNKLSRPGLFNPATPDIEDKSIIHIPIGSSGHPVAEDGDMIEDKTIVECRYDTRLNMWFAMRTRYDKTLELTNSLERQADTWRTITEGLRIVQDVINPANMYESSQRVLERLKGILLKYKIPELDIQADMRPAQLIQADMRPAQLHAVVKEKMSAIKEYFSSPEMLNIVQKWGNDMSVALNIWNTIHYPVTEDMICHGRDIPDIDMVMEKYYSRDPTLNRKLSLTFGMQNFHNIIIKAGVILEQAMGLINREPGDRLRLLDMGTGKGGDLNKWKKSLVHEVVGIDLFPSNINDPIDGAVRRYEDMKDKLSGSGEALPVVNFLVGDMTKDIASGSAFTSEYKELYAKLWKTAYDELAGCGGYDGRKFNMMTAMFSVHYAFSSKAGVKALVKNIQDNLADGGVFAGCCFDGGAIYRALEGLPKGGDIQGVKGGSLIWRITKGYTDLDGGFPATDSSVGMPINVYVANIGQTIKEYLVNFDYFRATMEKAGLTMNMELSQMFADIRNRTVLSALRTSSAESPQTGYAQSYVLNNGSIMFMDKDEMRFSDFNRVFVFQRVPKTTKKTIIIKKKTTVAPATADETAPIPKPAKEPAKEPSVATIISKDSKPKLVEGDILEEPTKPKIIKVVKKKLKKDDLLADELVSQASLESQASQISKQSKKEPKVAKEELPVIAEEQPKTRISERTRDEILTEADTVISYLKRNDSSVPENPKYCSRSVRVNIYEKRLKMIETAVNKFRRLSAEDKTGALETVLVDKIKRLESYMDEMKSRK